MRNTEAKIKRQIDGKRVIQREREREKGGGGMRQRVSARFFIYPPPTHTHTHTWYDIYISIFLVSIDGVWHQLCSSNGGPLKGSVCYCAVTDSKINLRYLCKSFTFLLACV